jgi:hypothetical protein
VFVKTTQDTFSFLPSFLPLSPSAVGLRNHQRSMSSKDNNTAGGRPTIRTLADLNRQTASADGSDDSDTPQEYYTGGEERSFFFSLFLFLFFIPTLCLWIYFTFSQTMLLRTLHFTLRVSPFLFHSFSSPLVITYPCSSYSLSFFSSQEEGNLQCPV